MLRKQETQEYTYIKYIRESTRDFNMFKIELINSANDKTSLKDIVVDLSATEELQGPKSIASTEIGVMVHALKSLKGTPRYLNIVVDENIENTIKLTGIMNLGNFGIYRTMKEIKYK